jgi:hypothetical protein
MSFKASVDLSPRLAKRIMVPLALTVRLKSTWTTPSMPSPIMRWSSNYPEMQMGVIPGQMNLPLGKLGTIRPSRRAG